MRVETIEQLRCPASHEPSPLVTVAFERDGDWLIEGLLGCVVCGAEYALTDGIVHFGGRDEGRDADVATWLGREARLDDLLDPMRLGALLGLGETGMLVALCGAFADGASSLAMATGARCVVVNASRPDPTPDRNHDRLTLPAQASLPFGAGALQGLVIDAPHAALLTRSATAMHGSARVVGPVSAAVPSWCRELARDAHQWVAQVEAPPAAFVPLRSRSRAEDAG